MTYLQKKIIKCPMNKNDFTENNKRAQRALERSPESEDF